MDVKKKEKKLVGILGYGKVGMLEKKIKTIYYYEFLYNWKVKFW